MGGSVQFSDLGDLTKVGERKRLNDMLRAIFAILYGGIGGKMIVKNGIDGIHLSYEAKSSVTVGARNRIKGGNTQMSSVVYKIGEYDTTDFQPSTPYTFVVKGQVNEGQKLMVRFNDGANGGATADFNTDGIAIIRTTSPDSLTSQLIGFYNSPQATATDGEIEWACMYKGDITSPSMEWVPAPEDTMSQIELLAGAIQAKVSKGDLAEVLRWEAGQGIILGRVSYDPEETAIDMQLMNTVMNIRRSGVPVVWFGINGMSVTEGRVESSMSYGVYSQRVTADGGLAIG